MNLRTGVLCCLLAAIRLAPAHAKAETYDVLLRGGRVVDGTGAPWYVADMGIRDGKFVKIGRMEAATAEQVIEANGLVVAPGFIDMMGQTATPMLNDPSTAMNLLTQGITTINAGEGSSAAPVDEQEAKSRWRSAAPAEPRFTSFT